MKLIVRLEMTNTKHIWNTLMQLRSDFTDLEGENASYFLDKIIQKRPQCFRAEALFTHSHICSVVYGAF